MRPRARVAGVLTAAAVALGAPAAPALAGGFTLDLVPQSDAVVGRPLIVRATGTIPPADLSFPYWFSLDAIPPTVTTTCPPDPWEGAQFANANGGSIVVFTQSESPDITGRFTIPIAVTPGAPGSVLLCGYTDDGAASTLAGASLMLHIKPARSGAVNPRAYAAQGIRSCRALFARARRRACVRKIVGRANARCPAPTVSARPEELPASGAPGGEEQLLNPWRVSTHGPAARRGSRGRQDRLFVRRGPHEPEGGRTCVAGMKAMSPS